eukprot:1192330-Prorocentrum_minimum.AAC.3
MSSVWARRGGGHMAARLSFTGLASAWLKMVMMGPPSSVIACAAGHLREALRPKDRLPSNSGGFEMFFSGPPAEPTPAHRPVTAATQLLRQGAPSKAARLGPHTPAEGARSASWCAPGASALWGCWDAPYSAPPTLAAPARACVCVLPPPEVAARRRSGGAFC